MKHLGSQFLLVAAALGWVCVDPFISNLYPKGEREIESILHIVSSPF